MTKSEEQFSKVNKVMTEAFNRIVAEKFPDFVRRQAPYKYWQDKKENRYFHTTGKIEHKGNMRYVAGIYRYLKGKKQWKLVKRVGFAKKRKAIEWARKEYIKRS